MGDEFREGLSNGLFIFFLYGIFQNREQKNPERNGKSERHFSPLLWTRTVSWLISRHDTKNHSAWRPTKFRKLYQCDFLVFTTHFTRMNIIFLLLKGGKNKSSLRRNINIYFRIPHVVGEITTHPQNNKKNYEWKKISSHPSFTNTFHFYIYNEFSTFF